MELPPSLGPMHWKVRTPVGAPLSTSTVLVMLLRKEGVVQFHKVAMLQHYEVKLWLISPIFQKGQML